MTKILNFGMLYRMHKLSFLASWYEFVHCPGQDEGKVSNTTYNATSYLLCDLFWLPFVLDKKNTAIVGNNYSRGFCDKKLTRLIKETRLLNKKDRHLTYAVRLQTEKSLCAQFVALLFRSGSSLLGCGSFLRRDMTS